MKIAATPIKPHIGSIVHAERAALLDKEVAMSCLALLEERGVLVFPRINLSDAEQLAFTDLLGTRVTYVRATQKSADIYKISLDPKVHAEPETVQGTFFWHMDGLTSDIPPPKATVLTARRLSPKGGDTEFASTYAAYESLSASEKGDIAELRVVHSLEASLRHVIDRPTDEDRKRWSRAPIKEHPLIWTHLSGRKSLVVGNTAERVVGMPLPDGRSLLARLLEWTSQPDFYYRHQWQEGDLVIWNNCGTLHRVIPYDRTSGRLMHRTSIAGSESVV